MVQCVTHTTPLEIVNAVFNGMQMILITVLSAWVQSIKNGKGGPPHRR